MNVAQLILDLYPEFCARDEMIPGSIDYVAMMEILLLNRSCCKSRYGNAAWNKTTFLKKLRSSHITQICSPCQCTIRITLSYQKLFESQNIDAING